MLPSVIKQGKEEDFKMKKSSFVTLILGVISCLFFASQKAEWCVLFR